MSGPAGDRRETVTEGCRYCWMCRHVCPVGHVTSRETLTPHAWALTIESVRRGQLTWNQETAAVMYACADCGLCRAHCVTDQPLPDAIAAARAEIARAGVAPDAVRTYREQLHQRKKGARDSFSTGPPEIPSRALFRRALFVGETAAFLSGELAAARDVLEVAGLPAPVIGEGLDTGRTACSLGLVDEAADLAREVIAEVVISGATEIFVLTPADKWTFEHVYPVRLGIEWPAGVLVREATMAIAEAAEEGQVRFRPEDGAIMAYHDPCHSPRIDRDWRRPRQLLSALSANDHGRELFWRAERAHPCGAIGGLEFTHPALARDLALARCRDAAAAGAATLVTDDPTCASHLARHAGGVVTVRGFYSILAERLQS